MKNKIALFTGTRSLTGAAIRLATDCEFVHAAVQVNGRWYHASEQIGGFAELDQVRYANRHCAVYELPRGDLWRWRNYMQGREYDWPGVLAWIFKYSGNPEKFYCFEAAKLAMSFCGIPVREQPVSGCHLHDAFEHAGIFPVFGRFGVIT